MTVSYPFSTKSGPLIYSVTKLTHDIKQLLEEKYSIIWISGEISNIRIPSSGHAYFTLKDDKAQISAVMFKGQWRNLKFSMEDGLAIVAMGRISVYEPRGTYQIVLEYAEPQGLGSLQLAFEQLKRRLAAEGLFEQSAKAALPFLPRIIGVITSPTGAVVRDILKVIQRRFSNTIIEIIPVRVQGEHAADEIAQALALANQRKRCEVLILARGGGSLEDLAPFNTETVARAIFVSQIPVISAVGHETDYTIADFVADLRAPTPSAAAEMVIPLKSELTARILDLHGRICQAMHQKKTTCAKEFDVIRRSLVHPIKKVQDLQLRSDDLTRHLQHAVQVALQARKMRWNQQTFRLVQAMPKHAIERLKALTDKRACALNYAMTMYLSKTKDQLNSAQTKLSMLSPNALLKKGYSITRTLPHHHIVTSSKEVDQGQELEVLLATGHLRVTVNESGTSTPLGSTHGQIII